MNPRPRLLAALGLSLFLGCAYIPAIVAIGNATISVVTMLANAAQSWERAYFIQHPNADEQAKIERAIADVNAAGAVAAQTLVATGDLSSGQAEDAIAALLADYQDLQTLLKDLGVVSAPMGSRLTAEPLAGRLYLMAPEDLIPKGMNVEHVTAKAQVVRAARARANQQALRSPGEAKVPRAPSTTSGGTITYITGTAPLSVGESDLQLTVAADWRHADGCLEGMRNVSPMAPGAVCVRDGAAWKDVLAAIAGLHIKLDQAAVNPLAEAAIDMARAYQ